MVKMQWIRGISALMVIMGPGIILGWDLIAYYVGGDSATITSVVRDFAKRYHELPWITLALMVWLWAHLYLVIILNELKDR